MGLNNTNGSGLVVEVCFDFVLFLQVKKKMACIEKWLTWTILAFKACNYIKVNIS